MMDTLMALAGNPNSGKTTLFNALTGARQHVGNYPGVTVEKKQGIYRSNGSAIKLVDLPGTYSLTAYSMEEVVARDFLLTEQPAVVIDIVDATNLERHLYLTLQLMEMGFPVCIALNMMDVAKQRGIHIDVSRLSELLGLPIVPTVARNSKGKVELMAAAQKMVASGAAANPLPLSYGEDVDRVLDRMAAMIEKAAFMQGYGPSRWVALKYLENDTAIRKLGHKESPTIAASLEKICTDLDNHIRRTADTYTEVLIADQRYGYIRSLLRQGVLTFDGGQQRLFLSDRIDQVLTNRFLGPLIMIFVLLGLYQFTFTYSELPVSWLEGFFGWLSQLIETHMAPGPLQSLIVSGVIDGVGGVLGFVPLIAFMFLGIAFLEDSGYLARVAFMLDRIFQFFGLHGSAVMPFIISGGIAGGCAVPGVMATRTLRSRRERLATILTVPFMNCGAKLPIFALLVAAFFSKQEALIMFLITLISWSGALLAAKFLRLTVVKGPATPFVMELPPYRLPTFKGLLIHTWERTFQYIKKAGTVILGISILLWAMMTYPGLSESKKAVYAKERQEITANLTTAEAHQLQNAKSSVNLRPELKDAYQRVVTIDHKASENALRDSIAGRIGMVFEPISRVAGFDWRTNIALLGGFAAKEVVVSTLGTAYSLGNIDSNQNKSLANTLAGAPGWRPLTALSLIIFCIFYAPCFVSVVCIAREAGSWRWGAFSILFNTTLAFGLATSVYQIGTWFGF
jgi:ferrous iron transport protein B